MPRFFLIIFFILHSALALHAESIDDPARAEAFRAEQGFYASPAGSVALEMENRTGWRDAQNGFGLGSMLFLGSAVEMLIGVPEDRRAGRLYAEFGRDDKAREKIFEALADGEKRERHQRSILSLLLGAGLLTGGFFTNPSATGNPFFSVLGASALGGSLLSWILPGYYGSRAGNHTLASPPAPSFQFGISSLLGQGGRISAALIF